MTAWAAFLFGGKVSGETCKTDKLQCHVFLLNQIMEIKDINFASLGNPSKQQAEVALKYWKLNESLKFLYKPKKIRDEYNINQAELNRIVFLYSRLTYYISCSKCNSFEHNYSFSQNNFNQLVKKSRSVFKSYICRSCKAKTKAETEHTIANEINELYIKQNQAIDEKRWTNLTSFHNEVLFNCLSNDFRKLKKLYWKKLGDREYWRLFEALNVLELNNLIVLQKDEKKRTKDFNYIDRLSSSFCFTPKEEVLETKSKCDFNKETNELKFKLTINDSKKYPDSPIYAGVVTFKERIILEPGVEYSFAQWERANNNLFLTMIPTISVFQPPKQIPISEIPISLREGIENYFKTINPKQKN